MAYFYAWETKTLSIGLKNKQGEYDPEILNDYKEIIISIKQPSCQIDIREVDVDTEQGILSIHLDQEQTSIFKKGKARIQVNIYYNNEERDTSVEGEIEVRENLYQKVMNGND